MIVLSKDEELKDTSNNGERFKNVSGWSCVRSR